MTANRDEFDRRLLSVIQSRVPLVREPFADLAQQLGAGEEKLMDRLKALRGPEAVIREIAGIFDAAALGYRQALVAFRVPPAGLDQAGQRVAAHPGVSHCYGRRGDYNLWFTLAASPHSRVGLERTAERLAQLCGATNHRILPTLRRYKLDVRFGAEEEEQTEIAPGGADEETTEQARTGTLPTQPFVVPPSGGPSGQSTHMASGDNALTGTLRTQPFVVPPSGGPSAQSTHTASGDNALTGTLRTPALAGTRHAEALPGAPQAQVSKRPAAQLTQRRLAAIRALQVDLPIRRDPFAVLAGQADMSADDLLVQGADFLAAGWMRRYAAVLHHRAAGAAANVMVVWKVDPARADAAGAACAQIQAVSHCYIRPTFEDWPYALYTMVHGRNPQDCRITIEEIAATAGLREHLELWTEKEYKKQRVKLFNDAEQTWEEKN